MVYIRPYTVWACILLAFLYLNSCTADPATRETADSQFTDRQLVAKVDHPLLTEASGLAASRRYPGMVWAHNDSGDRPHVYLVDSLGQLVFTCLVSYAQSRDWEDMVIASGPEAGEPYLYMADIGDNDAVQTVYAIYRIKAPLWDGQNEEGLALKHERFQFVYPGGPRDAEAFMIDPISKHWYIITKREEAVQAYKLPYPQNPKGVDTLEFIGTLPYTLITAGDISKDGQEVLVKSYDWVFYWKRKPEESIDSLLQRPPVKLPYAHEPQGEAIAWMPDGKGYYTLSEEADFTKPHLYKYLRKK